MEKKPAPPKPTTGISEAEIRAKHDNMFKLRTAIKSLRKGFYLTDQQMRATTKIAINFWRSYADSPEFDKFRIKLGDQLYWGVPECIKKLREDLNEA